MGRFPAIFANVRRKKWRFSQKNCYGKIFAKTSSSLSQKRHYFRQIFQIVFKIITSVPGVTFRCMYLYIS
jgi:hypothetical protein